MPSGTSVHIEDLIATLFDTLGQRERAVARVVLNEYPVSALDTVAGLARTSSVSTATVLRLTGKLGFKNFGDFQRAVKRDLRRHMQSPSDRMALKAPDDTARASLSLPMRMATQLTQNIDDSFRDIIETDFDDAIELLSGPPRTIFCIGGRYSMHIARLFSHYLGSLRNNVYFVDGQQEGWARYLASVDRKSTVVVFDIRRYQRSVQRFARLARDRGAKVILVTDSWADANEYTTDLQFQLASNSASPMDSHVGLFAFMETLIAGFIEADKDRALKRLNTFDGLGAALRSVPDTEANT